MMISKKKILILEDNELIGRMLFLFLKDTYEVIFSDKGYDAIRLWKEHKPDLVILDIMLPDVSGYEVCETVKKDIEYIKTPVIFLSAMGGEESRVKGYELGAVNFLTKPVVKNELKAVIESTLSFVDTSNTSLQAIEYEGVKVNLDTYEVFYLDQPIPMTPNEFRILSAFIIKRECVMSREKILDALGRDTSSVSDRSIDSHISHLRKKISNTPLEIRSIYGEGYKLTIRKSDT